MPCVCDCSPTKGKAEPASAFLSPVARDYPSRALRKFFMPAAHRLFHQRTGANVPRNRLKSRFSFSHLVHAPEAVNNLRATLSTSCSRWVSVSRDGVVRAPADAGNQREDTQEPVGLRPPRS
jgi:hypothetical protein